MAARTLLPVLHAHLVSLRGLLVIAETERARRELATMAGETAVTAGQLWHTLHDLGEAVAAYRFALRLAHDMEEESIRAMALTGMGLLYANRLHEGEGLPAEPERAVTLLKAAETAAIAGASAHMRVWLYASRSWEHAGLGQAVAAGRDLDAAHRALAQTSAPHEGFHAPWDATYLLVCRGKCAMLLGDPIAGMRRFEEAARDHEQSAMARAYYGIELARACAAAGEGDRALALLTEAAAVAADTNTTMLTRRIEMIARRDLAPLAGHPGMRALRERLFSAEIPEDGDATILL